MHERPGVYSSYDASTVVSAGRAAKVIGVAAKAVKGTAGEVVTLTGYAAGVAAFGEDAADTPGMSTILRLLFANGASTVAAVRVAEAGAVKDYQDAFAALGGEEARILVCDSAEETVQQALRTAVEDASAARMERIAVVGGDGESAAEPGDPRGGAKQRANGAGGARCPGQRREDAAPACSPQRPWQGSSPPDGTRECRSTGRRSGGWGAWAPHTPTMTSTCWCGAA